jgi:hypothetical protein
MKCFQEEEEKRRERRENGGKGILKKKMSTTQKSLQNPLKSSCSRKIRSKWERHEETDFPSHWFVSMIYHQTL